MHVVPYCGWMSDRVCVIEEAAGIQWGQMSCQARQFDCLPQKHVVQCMIAVCFVSRIFPWEKNKQNNNSICKHIISVLVEVPLSKTMNPLLWISGA